MTAAPQSCSGRRRRHRLSSPVAVAARRLVLPCGGRRQATFRSCGGRRQATFRSFIILLLIAFTFLPAYADAPPSNAPLVVGSKRFTESYILASIIGELASTAGHTKVQIRSGLGNTSIVFAALKSGNIDLYPEYTGTIAQELVKDTDVDTLDGINQKLQPLGLGAAIPLGFNNTYALAMPAKTADSLHVTKISDLVSHPSLRLGLSHEFLNRLDGWQHIKDTYRLPFADPQGLDHDLGYNAIAHNQIDVIDVYSTDSKIAQYNLRVLKDDFHAFPNYQAVLLYRLDVPQRWPRAWQAINRLEGKISDETMMRLNARKDINHDDEQQIAADFLKSEFGIRSTAVIPKANNGRLLDRLFAPDFTRLTVQHLWLVVISLLLGVFVGVPLGILAAQRRGFARPILSSVGVIQTIPSLALLAFLIPLLHQVGTVPAIIALFLYSLLPIVSNTYTGLTDIAPSLQESARALGLSKLQRLLLIQMPLASRGIISGIKTSAVINVGTATIAAFIGAGGYGERIVSGLATGDNNLLLAGAIPAAVLALLVEFGFNLSERILVPAGLRVQQNQRS